MAEYKKWELTDNRFVAFLDIMGFTDEASRSTHEEIYSFLTSLKVLCDTIEGALKDYGETIKVFSFSDSVVVLSKWDSGVASFSDFSNAISKIVAISMVEGIPIKGGCAYGKVTWDEEKRILCGQAYIDAVKTQENLHYYGVACHHSIDYFFNNIKKCDKGMYIFESKTIFKDSDVRHKNIDWFYSILETQFRITQYLPNQNREYINEIINALKCNMSFKPRLYIENTLTMCQRYLETKPIWLEYGKVK